MPKSEQWCHNGGDGVSNHQPHHCLLHRLFRRNSKKTSKLRVTDFCAGNSLVTGELPAQMASNTENASIWWRHHVIRNKVFRRYEAGGYEPQLTPPQVILHISFIITILFETLKHKTWIWNVSVETVGKPMRVGQRRITITLVIRFRQTCVNRSLKGTTLLSF